MFKQRPFINRLLMLSGITITVPQVAQAHSSEQLLGVHILSSERREQSINLLWIVLGLRSGLFLAELIVGLWVHSLSLLAVAGHMAVDVLAIAVALVVAKLNRHRSNKTNIDPNHLEAWAALFNSLFLLGISIFIPWEAIKHIQEPQVSVGVPMLIMAVVGFVVVRPVAEK